MAQKILELEITANTDKLKKGLEDSKKALRDLRDGADSGLKKVETSFNSLDKQVETARQGFIKANATAMEFEKELQSLAVRLRNGAITQSQFNKEQREILPALASARQSAGQYQSRLSSLNATIQQGINTGRTYGNEAGRLQGVHDTMTKSIRGASGVSLEFSRIIQDLPYGIQGVANNFQQLTTNLGHYTANVKASLIEQGKQATTGAVVRGVLSSLVSPMSLVTLGVSAVTAGWVIYEKWAQRSAKATKEKKDETVKYIDTLKGLARAQADGQVGAQKDLTNLRLMYQATQDINIPMEKRREIAEQLIKQYPKQFEGLSKEAILAGTASKAYDSLTKSITATALASAYASKITENASKQLSNYLEILDKQNEANKLRTSIEKTRANFTTSALGAGVGASGASQSGAVARDVERVNNLMKEINSLGSENSKITNENRLLQQNYNTQLANGADATGTLSTGLDKVKDTTKSLVNDITKLTETLDYFGKTSGLSFFDSKLFDVNEKLRESLELIEKARRANKITSAEAERLTLLAEQTKEFEKQEVIMARFLDSAKKLQTLTGRTSGVGLSGSLSVPNQLPNLERNQFIINARQKYNASKAEKDDDAKLENRISKVIESGFRQGISSILGDITNLGSNFQQVFSNVFNNLAQSMSSILNNVVGTYLGDLFKKKLEDVDFAGLGNKASKAIIAGLGTAGSLVSGLSSKTSSFGQGLGGALSGAAMGATLGPVGAVVGGILGGVAGIFGAKKARKERELQEAQLREQEKQTKLQERIANLTYTSSIVGQVTNQGIINAIDRDAFGNIVGRINGKDIVLSVDRTRAGS